MGPVSSYTEWGKLEEVILGSHYQTQFGNLDTSMELLFHDNLQRLKRKYPNQTYTVKKEYVDEREEDTAGLAELLTGMGIKVRRPDPAGPTISTGLHGDAVTASSTCVLAERSCSCSMSVWSSRNGQKLPVDSRNPMFTRLACRLASAMRNAFSLGSSRAARIDWNVSQSSSDGWPRRPVTEGKSPALSRSRMKEMSTSRSGGVRHDSSREERTAPTALSPRGVAAAMARSPKKRV